jgi:LEA14-like dessication related protein
MAMDKATAEIITKAVNKINHYNQIKEGLKRGGKSATHIKLVHKVYGGGDAGEVEIEDIKHLCDTEIAGWVGLLEELGVEWVSGEGGSG